MANTTITGLPNASALTGDERVPMDQAGTTVDASAAAIAALATAATVGLGNVNNTSDANKPISTATQTALDGKVGTGDSRLSDARTPTDGSVTDAKIAAGGLSASSVSWVSIVPWAANTAYGKGDLVEYLGIAYRRTTAGTSGTAFVGTNWQQSTPSAVAPHTQAISTISDATATGQAVVTAANQAAARTAIGAGTSSVAVSSSTPAALGATAAAGSSADAARADHVHARSTYADLGAIGDGLVLVISNKGETATAATNYAEVPVPVPSGNFTLTAVRFGCHIDNAGSSSTTFNAYKRTAGGTKTSVLTGNATLGASASLVDVSGTITGGTFSAGDRIGVDLIGVGTGAQGLFAQFIFTRSAT